VRTVTVGRVLAAHGVAGGCKCAYHTDYPERLKDRSFYILRDPHSNEVITVTPKTLRLLKDSFLLTFNEITSREEMSRLAGWLLEVPEQSVPDDKEEGEFYFFELEGMEVVSAAGDVLGTVINVVRGTGVDILEVAVPGKDTRLIPFAKVAIKDVGAKARRITLQDDYEF
jgi:16S rRNA processing protein RimM